jgi:alpha-N-arabinofuranosidase
VKTAADPPALEASAEAPPTKVVIDGGAIIGPISRGIYGVNHRYPYGGFGIWDEANEDFHPRFMHNFEQGGFTGVRFPGGRIGNTYRWKRAIGPQSERTPNVNGGALQPVTNEYGPDEFGNLLERTGAEGNVMVNFATGSAREAADWVEYMNSPVGANPNGGRDWAEVRAANGHPEPYGIRYWEVGNEFNSGDKVYWVGSGASFFEKAQKYAFGGSTEFAEDRVARYADHRRGAEVSDGSKNQNLYIRYPPVEAGSANLFVDGTEWTRVEGLVGAGQENVYELNESTGKITFGDGQQGNIPPKGVSVTAAYTSGPHDGFVDFYADMKAVDPTIRVGAAIHSEQFLSAMGTRYPYDFVVVHSYGIFEDIPGGPAELHDLMMRLPKDQLGEMQHTKEAIALHAGAERAEEIEIVVTEYGPSPWEKRGIGQMEDPPPHYLRSLDVALYIGLLMRNWIELEVPIAEKHTLTDFDPVDPPEGFTREHKAEQAIIGPKPCFVPSATSSIFRMFTSMMGPTHVNSWVTGNPTKQIFEGTRLASLVPVSSIDEEGNVYLIVINRDRSTEVEAEVRQRGADAAGPLEIWSLTGPSFLSINTEDDPDRVSIERSVVEQPAEGVVYTFPPHSATAFKFTP